nr:hypothetical protein [Saprospiraceae bacterium]
MISKMRFAVFMLFFLLQVGYAGAQSGVMAVPGQEKLLIGERGVVTYSVPIQNDISELRWQYEKFANRDYLELLGEEQSESEDTYQLEIHFAVFDTGRVVIPSVTAVVMGEEVRDTLHSDSLWIAMVIPEDFHPELLPIKTIITEPDGMNWWIFSLVVLVIIGALIAYGLYIRKKKQELSGEGESSFIDPDEYALRQLRDLEKRNLIAAGEMDLHYTRLSYIFRNWIEDKFGIKAREMTGTELSSQLGSIGLSEEQAGEYAAIIATIEGIKYAKGTPDPNFHQRAFNSIKTVIEKAKNKADEEE